MNIIQKSLIFEVLTKKIAPKIFSLAPLMLFGTNKPIPEMEYFPKRNFGKQGEKASINHCIFL